MMIAKFGRIVNLEELETIGVNQQLEDVKDRLSVAEAERSNDLQLWNVRTGNGLGLEAKNYGLGLVRYDTIKFNW